MRAFVLITFALTIAMIVLHLATSLLLPKLIARYPGAAAVQKVLRFETLYYAVLLTCVALAHRSSLLVLATIPAALHLAGWALVERRPHAYAERPAPRLLLFVRLFDAAETLLLAWIAWQLAP